MAPPKLKRWAKNYDHCEQCKRNDRSRHPVKHCAKGLCTSCYHKPIVKKWYHKRAEDLKRLKAEVARLRERE